MSEKEAEVIEVEESLHYGGLVRLTFTVNPWHKYTVAVRDSVESEWSLESKIPSVTGVAGSFDDGKTDGICRWAANLATKYLKETFKDLRAANKLDEVLFNHHLDQAGYQRLHSMKNSGTIGTVVHEWVEGHVERILEPQGRGLPGTGVQDAELPINTEAANAVLGFLKWEAKYRPEYLFSERKVYSLKHHVAGTVDLGAIISGNHYVLDLKTSNTLNFGHKLQLAVYLAMLNEEEGAVGLWIKGKGLWTHRGIIKLHKNSTRISNFYDFNERAGTKNWCTQEEDMDAFIALRAVWYRVKELGRDGR